MVYPQLLFMRIVKRVSLFKSIQRISDPAPSQFKIDRMAWNKSAPYRLTTQQELYRTGYRDFKHRPLLIAAVIAAFIFGTFVESS